MQNKKSLFKNKLQMIVYLILFVIIIILFIVIGKHDFNKNVSTESEMFHQIFNKVEKENVFKFVNVTDVNNVVNNKNGTGIILFGFANSEWTNYYAKYLNEAAKEIGIKEIMYYDFEHDREERNGTYETIVNSLSVYTKFDDYNTSDIYAPTLLVIKNGKIILYNDSTSIRDGSYNPEIYWNDYQIEEFKGNLRYAFKNYIDEE